MSGIPATRPGTIEEDEAERRALEAAVAEARADPRSAPHAEVRAWTLVALTVVKATRVQVIVSRRFTPWVFPPRAIAG